MQEKGGQSVPTGCFKCGRPGHWSRDCPSSANPNANSSRPSSDPSSSKNWVDPKPSAGDALAPKKPQKKLPKTRPKLTPELLLSDDGLGYVLRHFPRSFKYRGRGHEASDLGNLIGLYAQWHSHLIPYYSFDQFIHKVQQVGATNRVRSCMRELRERVSNGVDPTKLHEPPVENDPQEYHPGTEDAVDGPTVGFEDLAMDSHDVNDIQEQMIDEIYEKTTEEACQSAQIDAVSPRVNPHNEGSVQKSLVEKGDSGESGSNRLQMTEEQRARMVANRLKALERIAAAAKGHSSAAT